MIGGVAGTDPAPRCAGSLPCGARAAHVPLPRPVPPRARAPLRALWQARCSNDAKMTEAFGAQGGRICTSTSRARATKT